MGGRCIGGLGMMREMVLASLELISTSTRPSADHLLASATFRLESDGWYTYVVLLYLLLRMCAGDSMSDGRITDLQAELSTGSS